MNRFNLGPKAILDINRFQAILARYPYRERVSMVKFLLVGLQGSGSTTGLMNGTTGNVRGIATSRKAVVRSRGTKRARAWTGRRVRRADGTFAPARARKAA